MGRARSVATLVAVVILAGLGFGQAWLERAAAAQSGSGAQAPRFEVDPLWPKPLPNHWLLGNAIGVWVDERDHVWIIHRGSDTLNNNEKGLELKSADFCCAGAPPVLEFDASGHARAVAGAGPGTGYDWPDSNHGIFVDHLGNVWIGGNGPGDSHIVKFTRDGKFVAQYGKPNARVSGKNSSGQADVRARQHGPGELRPRREDLRRAEGERSLHRRRLLQPPRRGARRGDRQDEAVLGRVRQSARRLGQHGPVRPGARRRPSSSTTRCTAPTCRRTASSTSAIA